MFINQYRLTIAMFMAGTCAILIALSISLASNPNASDLKAAAVKNLHARAEKSTINIKGGYGGSVHGVIDPLHIN